MDAETRDGAPRALLIAAIVVAAGAIIAILISSIVGVIFGTVPASRASQLDPVESLRYE